MQRRLVTGVVARSCPATSSPAAAVVSIGSLDLVVILAFTLISRWMTRICRPNELLVVTGSNSNQAGQE